MADKIVARAFKFGEHFSAHLHGIIMYPKSTIKKLTSERLAPQDALVPVVTAILAGLMTAIGSTIWNVTFESSAILAFIHTVLFFLKAIALPFWFLFLLVSWTVIFHFLGSIVSGKDISNWDTAHRTLKLVGISMAVYFLNLLPFVNYIVPYWFFVLMVWGMSENYGTSWKGGVVITLPLLFVIVTKSLSLLGVL